METNETSIKKLLQDHPECVINIRLDYSMLRSKDIVTIRVIDTNHNLELEYGILDLMLVQKSPENCSGLPMGYDKLFKKIDEKLKENGLYEYK